MELEEVELILENHVESLLASKSLLLAHSESE